MADEERKIADETIPQYDEIEAITKAAVKAVLKWPAIREDRGLPRWKEGDMQGNVPYKVYKFVSSGLVRSKVDGYQIRALKGYNSQTRHLDFDLHCDCQGYKTNGRCSHQLMVLVWRKLLHLRDRGIKIVDDARILINVGGDTHMIIRDNHGYWCSCQYFKYHHDCKHIKEIISQADGVDMVPARAFIRDGQKTIAECITEDDQ